MNITTPLRYSFYLAIVAVIAIGLCYAWVSFSARKHLYTDVGKVPKRQVGLVLGTNKYLRNKQINQFYQNRITAAAKLYHAGKIDYLVVSGDNRKNNYNEPKQMRADLIKAGVPSERIQPDYAGLRTLDSVLRMDKVFGHQNYTLISQKFHNERAVFLARAKGQTPIAFNAADPDIMFRVLLREVLARVKAVWDLISGKQARHYGTAIVFPPDKH